MCPLESVRAQKAFAFFSVTFFNPVAAQCNTQTKRMFQYRTHIIICTQLNRTFSRVFGFFPETTQFGGRNHREESKRVSRTRNQPTREQFPSGFEKHFRKRRVHAKYSTCEYRLLFYRTRLFSTVRRQNK